MTDTTQLSEEEWLTARRARMLRTAHIRAENEVMGYAEWAAEATDGPQEAEANTAYRTAHEVVHRAALQDEDAIAADTRAAGGALPSFITASSVSIAAPTWTRTRSRMSTLIFGRLPGLPDTPFWNRAMVSLGCVRVC